MSATTGTVSSLILPGNYGRVDPDVERQRIMERVGDMSDVTLDRMIFGNRVLVAKFIVENVVGSTLLSSSTGMDEQNYQGKVGLVLKCGHSAFKSDAGFDFGPDGVRPGDWIWYRYSDGVEFVILEKGKVGKAAFVHCKVLEDTKIGGVLPSPDFIK